MKQTFSEQYFQMTHIDIWAIRKDISAAQQGNNETMHDYWERFKRLCAICPHHQIPKGKLIAYFYEGLLEADRIMLDVSAGGSLGDKTAEEAKHLIETMAKNCAWFEEIAAQSVGSRLEQKIETLTKMVEKMCHNKLTSELCFAGGHEYTGQKFSQPSQQFAQPRQTCMLQQYQQPKEKSQLDEILELMRDMNHRFDMMEKTVGEISMKVAELESKIEEQF